MSTTVEIDYLTALEGLSTETPQCEGEVRTAPWTMDGHRCPNPSVARVKTTCAECGEVWIGFLCEECLEAVRRPGDFGCGYCPGDAVYDGDM